MRVLSVESVKLSTIKTNPPKLMVEADGMVGTPGWSDFKLVPLEKKLSADGILDLEFVGTPPTNPVPQVVRPATADLVYEKDVDRIVGVLVHARTNNLFQLRGINPNAEIERNDVTTLAIGEEDIGAKTLAFGEEKSPAGEKLPFEKLPTGEKTVRFGEEKIPFGEKSPVFGEEKFPGGEKTGLGIETEAIGETVLGGETTFGGETDFVGESGPIGIETDPGIETDTGPIGEDFQDVFRDRIRTPFNRR